MRTNHRAVFRVAALVLLVLAIAPRTEADPGSEGETVEQIIGILKAKGLIDDDEQERLLMKHASEGRGAPDVAAGHSILDGWDFYGDFRLRHELFTYRHDPNGSHQDNQYRFRYRVRLGFEKELSDTLAFGMRMATGGTPSTSEDRSTNQTLGRQEDFDYDSFRIDRAYIRWQLPETGGLKTTFVGGKIANPFVWQHGKDLLMFDPDLQPEGGALLFDYALDERSSLFASLGYFIIDENTADADPKLVAAQFGATTEVGPVEIGLRGSMYWWRSLDGDYIFRSEEFGNLPTAYQGGKARIGDLSAFFAMDLAENWPALLYGSYAKNFTADSGFCTVYDDGAADPEIEPIDCSGSLFTPPAGPGAILGASSVGAEDNAWSAGVELGSSKEYLKLGFGYFYIEANAIMGIFGDSDVLDGVTNRRGWVVYGGRKITANTEFKFAYYQAKYIDRASALFLSTTNSRRSRLQTDVIFKF